MVGSLVDKHLKFLDNDAVVQGTGTFAGSHGVQPLREGLAADPLVLARPPLLRHGGQGSDLTLDLSLRFGI